MPHVVCPRCTTPDPAERTYWGWEWDDLEEARENPSADWDDILWAERRCRSCNYSWRVELERKPGRAVDPE